MDIIYCDSSFFSFQSEEGHSPITVSSFAMSDHSPISTKILINKVDNVDKDSSKIKSFKLNTSLLKDPNNKEAIRMVTFLSKFCNQFVRAVK